MADKVYQEVRWVCPICKSKYPFLKDAVECFEQGFKPKFKVGDIVTTVLGDEPSELYYRHWWIDGDEEWAIVNKDDPKERALIYVVSYIDKYYNNPHRPEYHLATNAMTGKQGYSKGYTYDTGHICIAKVDIPSTKIVTESKKLLGIIADQLL